MKLISGLVLLFALVAVAVFVWPGLRRYNDRTRLDRARHDEEAIRGALVRFYEDNTFFPLWIRDAHADDSRLERVDLLVSGGALPKAAADGVWTNGRVGQLDDALIANAASYAVRQDPDGPGWNGPYARASTGPDPWNHRYVVNIGSISSPDDVRRAKYAVWVLSAGPNGIIETSYQQTIAAAGLGGDDIGVRVQ